MEYDLLYRHSCALLARGMTLDVGSVLWYSDRYEYKKYSRCVYLKPVSAPELPFWKLYGRVTETARHCRCGACFACLRAAGCMN